MRKSLIALLSMVAVLSNSFGGSDGAAAEKCVPAAQQDSNAKQDTEQIVAGDILEIIADNMQPKPTYRIQPLDRLKMSSDGGYGFGRVGHFGGVENWKIGKVSDLTLSEAAVKLRELNSFFSNRDSLQVVEFGLPIAGRYRVTNEGDVWLPGLGGISVAGCTIAEANETIAQVLSTQFDASQIEVQLNEPASIARRSNANQPGREQAGNTFETASIQIMPDPYEVPARPSNLPEIDEKPQRIEFSIAFVEDRENALAEFDDVGSDPNQSCLRSQAILPALRVLEKHGVIKMLSVPRIVCMACEEVKLETNIAAASYGAETDTLTFKVYGGQRDGTLRLGFNVESTLRGVRQIGWMGTHFSYEPGETLLVKRHLDESNKGVSSDAPPTYVVLTPRIVSGAGKRTRGFDGFGIANLGASTRATACRAQLCSSVNSAKIRRAILGSELTSGPRTASLPHATPWAVGHGRAEVSGRAAQRASRSVLSPSARASVDTGTRAESELCPPFESPHELSR